MKYKIAVVDDHELVLKSLILMLNSFPNFTVIMEATSGEQFIELLKKANDLPDILLLDVNMPGMGGIETARYINENYPLIKMAALSMNDNDAAILGMLDAGICSYLLKNNHPDEIEIALLEIAKSGFYNADSRNINFRKLISTAQQQAVLTPKEKIFLPYACSDLTYKQIAVILGVTEPTIENYRKSLFSKFNVQSRTGLAMEALRRKLVEL